MDNERDLFIAGFDAPYTPNEVAKIKQSLTLNDLKKKTQKESNEKDLFKDLFIKGFDAD